jgi:hypothetical protein
MTPVIRDDPINSDAFILKIIKIKFYFLYMGMKLKPFTQGKESRLWESENSAHGEGRRYTVSILTIQLVRGNSTGRLL